MRPFRLFDARRRDESGLTTLEWLLIVAAVAGLAALAVVLVQNVVDDTAEQIGGSSARKTAAEVAANSIVQDSKTYEAAADQFSSWSKWENYFTNSCDRLEITYGDAGITATPNFKAPTTTPGTAPDQAKLDAITATGVATTGFAICAVT